MQLVTPRLLMREMTEGDLAAMQIFDQDPIVTRWQSYDVRTADESLAYLRKVIQAQAEMPRQVWDFALVTQEGDMIGRCGMRLTQPEVREATLWYVVARAHWGHGYGPEAARALVDHAFGPLGLHRVFVDIDPRNTASVRVAEKLGLRREAHHVENAFYKGEWSDSVILAILDREWKA